MRGLKVLIGIAAKKSSPVRQHLVDGYAYKSVPQLEKTTQERFLSISRNSEIVIKQPQKELCLVPVDCISLVLIRCYCTPNRSADTSPYCRGQCGNGWQQVLKNKGEPLIPSWWLAFFSSKKGMKALSIFTAMLAYHSRFQQKWKSQMINITERISMHFYLNGEFQVFLQISYLAYCTTN